MQSTLPIPPLSREKSGIELNTEPFRLMFPAGVLVGLIGVALWPLSIWEMLPFHPGPAHARLMIGGFFGAMILGFLGTAGPRMLETRFLSRFELWTLFSLWAAAVLSACANQLALADGLAGGVFLFGFRCAFVRFRQRKALPPPGFAMVIVGLLSGFVGALLNFGVSLGLEWLPAPHICYALGKLLFYQAFILLPILGVAPFFFPRFGGLSNPPASFTEIRKPGAVWVSRALIATTFALGLVATFVLEAFGWIQSAGLARAAMSIGFILWQVPLRYQAGQVGTLGRVVQVAVILLAVGILLPALFPAYQLGLLHLLFIGGFNLITLSVANWVIFGHSGAASKGRSKLPYVRWGVALILAALATRLIADFVPHIRATHLAYAAVGWIAGMVVWAWRVLPRVAKADEG